MKTSTRILAATAGVLAGAAAHADPRGGTVVAGSAVIATPGVGSTVITQASDRAVIDWRSFSLASKETVEFRQPSTSSATLNRVRGGERSVIDGTLSANGNVFLLNSSGVLFGKTAKLDVGGLVVSTGHLSDSDFMAGRFALTPAAVAGAGIVNEGLISVRQGGVAALVAPSVRNDGVILARMGKVALSGSEMVTVDLYGDSLISFSNANLPLNQGATLALDAAGAAQILDDAVNLDGMRSAPTARVQADGTVVLGGRIDVSGPRGGQVDILAGDVVIGRSALIAADAEESGDGGRVSVWGTRSAIFEGRIGARGGSAHGDGGSVEVSSAGDLRFLGEVLATAANGKAGTVLLDPESISIEADGSSSQSASVIDGDALSSLLRTGQNVVLDATSSIAVNYRIDGRPVAGSANPDAASGSIAMAAGSIVINAPVITNKAAIALTARTGDVTISGDGFLFVADGAAGVGTASVTIDAARDIAARAGGNGNGQIISLGAITLRATGSATLESFLAGLASTSGPSRVGALVVTAQGGAIRLAGVDSRATVALTAATGASTTGTGIVADGDVRIDGGTGGVTIANPGSPATAAIQTKGSAGIDLRGSGPVVVNGSLRTAGGGITIGSTAAPVASFSAAADTTLQTGETAGDLSLQSTGNVVLRGANVGGGISIAGATIVNSEATLLARTGDASLAATGSAASAVDLTVATAKAAAVETLAAGRSVTIRTPGGVNLQRGIKTNGGAISVGSAAAPVASLATAADAVIDSGATAGSVELRASGVVGLHGLRTGGTATVAGSAISNDQASLVAGGDVLLAAGAGGIDSNCIGTAAQCDGAIPADPGDRPALAVEGAADVTLATAGVVSLESGIKAAGNVAIGSSAVRVSSLTMAPGTGIQAGSGAAAARGISVYSTGNIAAQDLIVGEAGQVLLDADDAANVADVVRLAKGLGGFDSSGGVGALKVLADGAVFLNGATASGVATTRDIDISGASIDNATGSLIGKSAGNAAGESIVLSATSTAAGAITLHALGAATPVIAAQGAGAVSLRTTGGVQLDGGIRTAGGGITIGSTGARAASVTAGGALRTGGSGAIDVVSSGPVALSGITAGGAVGVTGSRITNELASLTAGGSVTLTAGSAGIELRCIGTAARCDGGLPVDADDIPAGAIDSGAGITLKTTGAIALGGGLKSVGDVVIGDSTLRASSFDMVANTGIETRGAVSAFLGSGAARFGRIIAGPSAGVVIDGTGAVELGAVSGPSTVVSGNVVADPTGYLDVRGASIVTRGVRTAASFPTGVGNERHAVRLIVGAKGAIDILGPIESTGGSLLIGLQNPLPGATPVYGPSGDNARINLSNNLLTAGHAITLNGDVTLFSGIDRWQLGVANGAASDLFLPMVGDNIDGTDSLGGTGGVGFSTSPITNFRHDPSTFPYCAADACGPDLAVTFDSGTGNYTVDKLIPEAATIPYFVGRSSVDWVAVNANGTPHATRNDAGCGQAWICRYSYVDDYTTALSRALVRKDRLQDFMGQLSLTISTKLGGAASVANVVVNGDLRRFVPANVGSGALSNVLEVYPSFVNHTLIVQLNSGADMTVSGELGDTYGSSKLTASSTGGSAKELNEFLNDLRNEGVPRLGLLRVLITTDGTDHDEANLPLRVERNAYVNELAFNGDLFDATYGTLPNWSATVVPGAEGREGLQYWQQGASVGAPVGGRITIVPRVFYFPVPWTNGSRGSFDNDNLTPQPNYSAPATFGSLAALLGNAAGSAGSSSTANSGTSASAGSVRNASNATTGTGLIFDSPPVQGAGDNPTSPPGQGGTDTPPPTADDPSRRTEQRETTPDERDTADDPEQQCPRGASRTADIGTVPGIAGAEPAVFIRCSDDFS